MKKTKAAFRALREECGLSQQDVANEAGVSVLSVKKWESDSSDIKEPPDDVWRYLLACREVLEETARAAASKVKSMTSGDETICVVYYRKQEDLDGQKGAESRPYGYVNAVTRRTVQLLCEAHIDVDILYAAQVETDGIKPIGTVPMPSMEARQ